MEQMTIDVHKPETLPAGYLPCSNPDLVEGYMAISDILAGPSVDFTYCEACETIWCDHNMDYKREDESYKVLVEHFRNGGMINIPILRYTSYYGPENEQSNGHHRVIAALDAGFTHIPYQTRKTGKGWSEDWSGTPAEDYGFRVVTDAWGDQSVREA